MEFFKFYNDILEDEKKSFGVQNSSVTTSLTAVGITYSQKALKKGDTYIDYNIPSHRCAYLYKFATCHTGFVHKYFRKLMRKRSSKVASVLKNTTALKSSLKICCLGGGPGTDAVGIIKALALYPTFDKVVANITVLDICGGWRNTFKRIIQKIKDGELKGVSGTFLNSSVNTQLIQVDLMEQLSTSVLQIIQEADIICMVKFVSAVIGKPSAEYALQYVMSNTKEGAVVLFIDNLSGNVFQSMDRIACNSGLQNVLGPENTMFLLRGAFQKDLKEKYGCLPLQGSKLSIAGWINDASFPVPVCMEAQSDFYGMTVQAITQQMSNIIIGEAQKSEICSENTFSNPYETDEESDFENGYSSDDFSTSLEDQESDNEFDSELLAKEIAEHIASEQETANVSGESFKSMVDRIVHEHLKHPNSYKRSEGGEKENKAQWNSQILAKNMNSHTENKYDRELCSHSVESAVQQQSNLPTTDKDSKFFAIKNDFKKSFCDKATQTGIEEKYSSLLRRLDNLIVSFEDIGKRLNYPCHHCKNKFSSHNDGQAATPAFKSPVLVLPLQNLKDDNLSQICSFISSNYGSSNSSLSKNKT